MEIILGVIASLITQGSKKIFGTKEYGTLATVVILSVAAAFGYNFLASKDLLPSLYSILTTAGAFYTFIIARFDNTSNSQ